MEENRRKLSSQKLSTQSPRIQERLQLENSIKDKEIKKTARHVKTAHMDNIAMKVLIAAERID